MRQPGTTTVTGGRESDTAMVRNSYADEESPDIETVLDALHDDDCRTIIEQLTEPMTADEISEKTGVPLSTTYRKLDALTESGLVAEGVTLSRDGAHASQYIVAFDGVSIKLTEEMERRRNPGRHAECRRAPRRPLVDSPGGNVTMLLQVTSLIIGFKVISLVLGGLITYLSFKAYRKTPARSLVIIFVTG
jgi:DNA-binding transcriptional ArsR family regulator